MSLSIINQKSLLDVWDQLISAYYDKNKFGGNVAEVYAYAIANTYPSYGSKIFKERDKNFDLARINALYEILKMFKEKYYCKIFVNNRKLGKWLKKECFSHRVHIRIEKEGI